jgi:hypothetical protein
MLKLCKVLMFGVVLVITSELKSPLFAADNPPTTTSPSTATPAPLAYEGKVVVVDRTAKTVTVEIQKRLYLFKFGANAAVVRKGKKVTIDELSAGQQVTIQLIQTTTGEVLVASVNIASGPAAEAAGVNETPSETTPSSDGARRPYVPISNNSASGGSPVRPVASPYN